MSNVTWPSGSASIVVLPSGEDGKELLELAQQWSASWLLCPTFWVTENQIPSQSDEVPVVHAFILGRNEAGESAMREVDLFWALGSQVFQLIRFLAVRTKQSQADQDLTSAKVKLLAKYLDASKPQVRIGNQVGEAGTALIKLNLVFGQSGEAGVIPRSVLEPAWDANIVAAPEDRPTPGSFDAYVRGDERNYGFILAHIATAGGLWAGLPKSTYEFGDVHHVLGRLRFQRVFVRAVATDKLSGDLAKWALDKASSPDNKNALGRVSGSEVSSIKPGFVDQKVKDLIAYLLEGTGEEHFLYKPLPRNRWRDEEHTSLLRKLSSRIRDFAEGLAYLPRWGIAMINLRIDHDVHEEKAKGYLPARLDPRFDLIQADEILNQPRPKVQASSADLWKHVREALFSAIDSPPTVAIPEVLVGPTGERLIFGDTRTVLPDPDDVWNETELAEVAGIHMDSVSWLDVSGAEARKGDLNAKKIELAYGMDEARAEMKETQSERTQAIEVERKAIIELARADFELRQDIEFAEEMRGDHTHDLPLALVGPSRATVLDSLQIESEQDDDGQGADELGSEIVNV